MKKERERKNNNIIIIRDKKENNFFLPFFEGGIHFGHDSVGFLGDDHWLKQSIISRERERER
jgi:hypothetical protein